MLQINVNRTQSKPLKFYGPRVKKAVGNYYYYI